MVRPFRFRQNKETAATNAFLSGSSLNPDEIDRKAKTEFDGLTALLKNEGIELFIVQDDGSRDTPDSIFPNNWISFHETCTILYPMLSESRRREKDIGILEKIKTYSSSSNFFDLSIHEKRGLFLEGTGSLVFDHERRFVYAALSPRTHEALVHDIGRMLGYVPVTFHTSGPDGNPIYHTNVVLTIGMGFAMLGSENIPDTREREQVISFLERSGKKLILLNRGQISAFAGNSYELINTKGEHLILMSDRAFHSLEAGQISVLSGFGRIIHTSVEIIENLGGGSVRCMIAHMNAEAKG